ncbi:MAG: aminoglycoside phosphotransferase family protein [Pseudonocardiaceae bacterium]
MGASSVPQHPPARAIDVSTLVRRKALHLGQPGHRWLARLPDLVAELQHEWSLTLLEPLTGGSASSVVRVRTADDRDAVLKLPVPSADVASQVRTLGSARGQGYVHLLAHNPARHAMLLESLGPSLDQLGWLPERAIDVLCHTLRQAWRVHKLPHPRTRPKR